MVFRLLDHTCLHYGIEKIPVLGKELMKAISRILSRITGTMHVSECTKTCRIRTWKSKLCGSPVSLCKLSFNMKIFVFLGPSQILALFLIGF